MDDTPDESGARVGASSAIAIACDGTILRIIPSERTLRKNLKLMIVRDFCSERNWVLIYQPTDTAVVLFDIQSHVSIDGHEPSLDEAKQLYSRWFGVDPNCGRRVWSVSSARSAR